MCASSFVSMIKGAMRQHPRLDRLPWDFKILILYKEYINFSFRESGTPMVEPVPHYPFS